MEEENKRSFKVEDRRRFSSEGELKPEHRAEEASQPSSSAVEGATQSSASVPPPPPPDAGASHGAAAAHEVTFAGFMLGLSTQALMMLGEIADPHGEESGLNLPAAQQLIDIIGMLQEKTRGNLDKDEQALVQGILFELRMKYVERARGA